MIVLSTRQQQAVTESNARINIFEGPVRAGKSYSALYRWIVFCHEGQPGPLCVVGRSQSSLKRNFIEPMRDLLGDLFQYFEGKREAHYAGRIMYVIGANDERATGKIQGSTFAGAWVDEVTLIPESFFKMLLSRLSLPDAKLFSTCNPDSPYHWLRQDYILKERELDCKVFSFNLDDNPSLTEKFKQDLKREYSGLYYRRFIAGEWCLAEGTVYDFFDQNQHVITQPPTYAKEYFLGIDYGTTNPFAAVLIGYNDESHPALWVEKEYYYDSRKRGRQKTDAEYYQEIWRTFYELYPIRMTYCDPSAASYIVETKRHRIPITQANNDVLAGIRCMANLLMAGDLVICSGCTQLIQDIGGYVWDDKSVKLGVDKPLKVGDHCLDAIRYVCYSRFGEGKQVNKQYSNNLKTNPLTEMGPGWRRVDSFHGVSAFN